MWSVKKDKMSSVHHVNRQKRKNGSDMQSPISLCSYVKIKKGSDFGSPISFTLFFDQQQTTKVAEVVAEI